MLKANDIRYALIGSIELVDQGRDVLIETSDGWLCLSIDPTDNKIAFDIVSDDGVAGIAAMITAGEIIDHPIPPAAIIGTKNDLTTGA